MAFTTDKSAFELVTADQSYRCGGCGMYIGQGQPMLTRPFIVKRKETGKTRLHDRDDCFEAWEANVLEKLSSNREKTGKPWKSYDEPYHKRKARKIVA